MQTPAYKQPRTRSFASDFPLLGCEGGPAQWLSASRTRPCANDLEFTVTMIFIGSPQFWPFPIIVSHEWKGRAIEISDPRQLLSVRISYGVDILLELINPLINHHQLFIHTLNNFEWEKNQMTNQSI